MPKFFLRVSDWPQGLDQARRDLLAGAHRHDVLEQAIRVLEIDPADDSVGYGGFPNILGTMELDACFMDGNTRAVGGIAGITHFLPVRVARRLMEREFHTLLAGSGAESFAHECGLSPEPTLSEAQRLAWERNIKPRLGQKPLYDLVRDIAQPTTTNFDTTIMIASDGNGISAAASSSGFPYKYPGRVGDAPLAGAGLYVDSRYGGAACNYTGEMAIRIVAARVVVENLKAGRSAEQAVHAAMDDALSLTGGLIRTLLIHAIDPDGTPYAAAINAAKPLTYSYWREGMAQPEQRPVFPYVVQH